MAVYCNQFCLKNAWHEFHKWECDGMSRHFWHDSNAYFALRMLFIGVPFNFNNGLTNNPNCNNVYECVKELKTNIRNKTRLDFSDILKVCIVLGIIVNFLLSIVTIDV